jgi:hypothetical protein
VIHLYDRDAKEAAEVLGRAAAIIEASVGTRIDEAVTHLMGWAGDTVEARALTAGKLWAIVKEIEAQEIRHAGT